jgi:zinc transport system ATP-binding protein
MIEIEDVSFAYEKNPILENVSLKINKGDFVVVFGPNGGGKTTLLKVIMGFCKPQRGEIHLSSNNIGYVPQVARFDKQFPISVLELVLTGALSQCSWWGGYPKTVKEKGEEALKTVELWDLKDETFGNLSGGQAQRALIARALICNPEILLLDEPIASVDNQSEMKIYDLLLKLKGEMTIVMVTHDLQPILGKADRLFCIRKTATPLLPEDACGHFAIGLYHD